MHQGPIILLLINLWQKSLVLWNSFIFVQIYAHGWNVKQIPIDHIDFTYMVLIAWNIRLNIAIFSYFCQHRVNFPGSHSGFADPISGIIHNTFCLLLPAVNINSRRPHLCLHMKGKVRFIQLIVQVKVVCLQMWILSRSNTRHHWRWTVLVIETLEPVIPIHWAFEISIFNV